MHMADALLSPAVGGAMFALSAGALGLAVRDIHREEDDRKIPMMGVLGAFVFAAQMINVTIPGTGSSVHIGGGILLAALLGPSGALLSLGAVLLIQCLFFADGGLLAYGCNVFNMGVVTCLFAWRFIYRPLTARNQDKGRLFLASILAAVVGLQLGSLCVVTETLLSGITRLPLGPFLLLMQPIHLAAGLVEGLVTGAVLCYVQQIRPELLAVQFSGFFAAKPQNIDRYPGPLPDPVQGAPLPRRVPLRRVLVSFVVLTLVTGGILSIFASSYPDGLEWSLEKTEERAGLKGEQEPEGPVYEAASSVVKATAFMPDYAFPGGEEEGSPLGTSAAGIIGSLITVAVACGLGVLIRLRRRAKT